MFSYETLRHSSLLEEQNLQLRSLSPVSLSGAIVWMLFRDDFCVTFEELKVLDWGETMCVDCSEPMDSGKACPKCKSQRSAYSGLIFHDLGGTAPRNLRHAGIPETVIMKIGG